MAWEVRKLEEVCKVVGGGTPSKSNDEFYKGNIPWATVRDMKNEIINETEYKITEEAVRISSTNIIPRNNVIIATRVGLGKVCFIKNDTAINQDLRGVIPKDLNKLSVNYLFYWFKNISHLIEKEGTGATVKGVKLPFIKSLQIPLPWLSEQKRIVALIEEAFEVIDKAKENAEKNLQNAKELFESYLQSIFVTQGDDWEGKTLNEISDNLDGKRIPITKNKRKSGIYPYYGASGVVDYVDDYIFDEDLLLISEDGANLLARTKPIAFSVSGKIWVNNHAHVLKFKNKSTQKYVELYLESIDLSMYITGAAQPKLNQRSLNSIVIPFPSLTEQQKIVEKVETLSTETKRLEEIYQQKITNLDELKKSILQKAFNGEL